MTLALTLFGTTLHWPDAGMSWKVCFLALLAAGAYLALAGPGKLLRADEARGAQIAVGLFALMSAAGAATIMIVGALSGTNLFAGDTLATPATPLAVSLVAMLGAQTVIRGAQKRVPGAYNIGFMASWPTFLLGTFDALALGYLLLGRAAHAGWTADRQGALILTAATAVATSVMVLGWCVYVARRRELWSTVSRGLFVALVVASQETVCMIVHGAGHFAHTAAGLDLLAGGVAMGIAAFYVTMLAEDTAGMATAPQRTAMGTEMRPAPVIAFAPRETAQPEYRSAENVAA